MCNIFCYIHLLRGRWNKGPSSLIEAETKEEIYIHKGYNSRRRELENRRRSSKMNENISLKIPWVN